MLDCSVAVIPAGETRRIQTFSVFIVTMFFSIFAYVWMLIILVVTSPYRVEVWEAGATLGFIPILILFSYMAEKGWLDCLFCQNRKSGKVKVTHLLLSNYLFHSRLKIWRTGMCRQGTRSILKEAR